ncbi:hypothetical protein HI914_06399 [Erysiphe necator]|nr:hypothetical protein HI914_06399 [Erysiphe necator]
MGLSSGLFYGVFQRPFHIYFNKWKGQITSESYYDNFEPLNDSTSEILRLSLVWDNALIHAASQAIRNFNERRVVLVVGPAYSSDSLKNLIPLKYPDLGDGGFASTKTDPGYSNESLEMSMR